MMAAVAYITLGALIARALPDRRMKAYVLGVAVIVSLLVGVSRVYLGVHWPTDVLAGWLAGLCWALICLVGARALARRGHMDLEEGKRNLRRRRYPMIRLLSLSFTVVVLGLGAVTFLGMTESKWWWVRMTDFPRLQYIIALLVILAILAVGRFLHAWQRASLAVVALIALAYNATKIAPYFPLSVPKG